MLVQAANLSGHLPARARCRLPVFSLSIIESVDTLRRLAKPPRM